MTSRGSSRAAAVLAALSALALWTAQSRAADTPRMGPVFEDATTAAGLSFTHDNGATGGLHLTEIMGPGAALFDFDGDGDLDAYLVQGGRIDGTKAGPGPRGDALFRNELLPNGGHLHFTDVTAGSGLPAGGYGMGVAAADYDGDGRTDLYLPRLGQGVLLRNLGGGHFEDATTRAGIDDPGWGVSASFFDYDRDGRLDLFVAHYIDYPLDPPIHCFAASSRPDYCGPQAFRPERDRLFHNLGGGRFAEATALLGPHQPAAGLGVVAGDFDGDGWVDLYVANDGNPNHLWLNQQGHGFREAGLFAGVAVNRLGLPEGGMGVDAGDLAGDGAEELFVANLAGETNTLYTNLGGGLFEDASIASGLGPPSRPYTAFGTAFLDWDGDGLLDLVVVDGAVKLVEVLGTGTMGQPGLLFRNVPIPGGGPRFRDETARAGAALTQPAVRRGLAVGDVDDDGDPDLLIAVNGGPARLLLDREGGGVPWIGLRLMDASGADVPGALAVLHRAGAPDLQRRAHSDGSYASASDPRVLFRLGGGGTPKRVDVRWPDGKIESWPAPPTGRYQTLRRGDGQPPGAGGGR